MRVSEVFAHNSYPEYTYVERETGDLESDLENALRMRGAIVSISGPSKSGKSMLVKRVAKQSHITQIAEVTGSNINSVDELWSEALNNIGTPSATEKHSTDRESSGKTVKGGVDVGVTAGADSYSAEESEDTDVTIDHRRGLSKLIEEVDTDKFVLLIDDFHYIDNDVQPDIAEAIKGAAERGISVCVALVGYRSENLEKVNDDLTGRVRSIELNYWDDEDLREIAETGFEVLNVEFSESFIDTLVREAAGSPLLMQLLCYSACIKNDVISPKDDLEEISVTAQEEKDIFREAIQWGGYSDVVERIYQGAVTRGEDRVQYELGEEGQGDYYECCLRAIADNPPKFAFSHRELYNRVKALCSGKHPKINQIAMFCEKMRDLTEDERPDSSLVDWDEEEEMLNISEPGLLFNIRWAIRLGIHGEET